jgi:hypothetical protein
MTVSPSGKDAYPGNGNAKSKCKSAVDIVGNIQREFNLSDDDDDDDDDDNNNNNNQSVFINVQA